ncbi:glycolipid transfer protein [Arctopsyche grandis]|uniref:glycolipid transfer protein n=1 Tax=Arctopsyche grandis TaxID=121162 RepID=UPI00406D6E6C
MAGGETTGENFFNTIQKPFPDVVDGKLDTEKFLEAANGTVTLLEHMGRGFTPMARDLSGNVGKLTKVYLSDKLKNSTINDMLIAERDEGKNNVAAEALIWYTRSIHYLELLLDKLLDEEENGSSDIKEILNNAYATAVKPYHKWLTQQAVTLVARASGMFISKASICRALNTSSDKDEFQKDYKAFVCNLNVVRCHVQHFLTQENLDNKTPV